MKKNPSLFCDRRGTVWLHLNRIVLTLGISSMLVTAEELSTPPTPKDPGAKQALAPRNDIPGLTNFAKVSDVLYRGAQPDAEGFAELKKMGVKTIINLRQFHSDRDNMMGTGLQYMHMYCKAWHPEDEDIVKFLKVLEAPQNQPVFVHCQHGSDRTGMMVASYRIVEQDWNTEEAAKETHIFGFHKIFAEIQKHLKNFQTDKIKKQIKEAVCPTLEVIK